MVHLSPVHLVDAWGFGLADPDGHLIGEPATPPLRRLTAIAPKHGPAAIIPAEHLTDPWGFVLADPAGTAIGMPGVTISRLIVANDSEHV